ncbi:MAG TPA: hypothetical protein VH142_15925 [Polyangiaceae bacterium]|jgi:hypothetical protein|nr:hypothetical protein [Polyangiaceae bacterium]
MRPLRAQLIAALTAFTLLLPGSAFARTQFFCHMMNRVVAACCCDTDSKSDDDSSCAVRVRASDCCERLSAAARAPTLKAPGMDVSVPPSALSAAVLTLVQFSPRLLGGVTLPRLARAPPVAGPPLFLLHCSILT